jgi:two-component system, OmpR family, phosphate regulon sensor histidine kinase PhoR
MRPKRLFTQLFLSFLIILALSLLAVTWISTRAWRQFYQNQTVSDLEALARLLAIHVSPMLGQAERRDLQEVCRTLSEQTGVRLTLVLPDGEVAADSVRDPAAMENHRDRLEIQAALEGRVGTHQRRSPTLGKTLMYVAAPVIYHDRVVGAARVALSVAVIDQALHRVYAEVGLGSLLILFLAIGLSLLLSRRITRPLEEMRRGAERFARGDLSLKLPKPEVEELISLAEALNHMAGQLDDRISAILRQRQEQEAVLASMVEGVMAVDSRARIISLNRAAAKLLEVEPARVEQRSITEVVRNPDLQWFITRALGATEPIEGEIVLAGDQARILQAHGATLRDPYGKALGVLIVMHDVTRLRKLENARRDFVANVSHELKTPITSIKGFVETLMEGAINEPEKAMEFLGIISRQVDRLHEIIEDLLSLSRIEQEAEQGRILLAGRRIKGVVQAAVQVCAKRAAEKGISVELDCPEDLRARINAPLLEQALVNLIDNAIKYSPPDSRVRVEAAPVDGKVALKVRDQGAGITKEHLPRLFERFYRVDPGRSRKIGGTGLGLAIVKHIAQAHGGRVSVESAPGQGSVFFLYLQAD